jgi:hypothetical protein
MRLIGFAFTLDQVYGVVQPLDRTFIERGRSSHSHTCRSHMSTRTHFMKAVLDAPIEQTLDVFMAVNLLVNCKLINLM